MHGYIQLQQKDFFLQGKLSEAQYKELLDISEYTTGQWFYHGTPSPIQSLDKTRPLAMSYSEDIAQQYAEAGMPRISASEIYKRTTGRAYPMPRNLRETAPSPIGTQEVPERMSFQDFEIIDNYVGGFLKDVQKVLREGNLGENWAGVEYRTQKALEQAPKLQRVIRRSVIEEPIVVHRLTNNTDLQHFQLEA